MNNYLTYAKSLEWSNDAINFTISFLNQHVTSLDASVTTNIKSDFVYKDLKISIFSDVILPIEDLPSLNIEHMSNSLSDESLKKVKIAYDVIEDVGQQIISFIQQGTCLLLLRVDNLDSHRYKSGSFRELIGVNLLVNVHIVPIAYVIDSILHEAIHGVLYQYETFSGPFFINDLKANELTKSPWTGNIITVDNLAQAVFVWFGLYNFWSLYLNCGHGNPDFARNTLIQIKTGFLNFDACIFQLEINKDMLEAIYYIKEKMDTLPA